jgi:hypothetical protein
VIILISSGETLNLNCEIRWNSVPCDEENFCMGMKILDPPTKYKELLKTLK